MITVHGRRNSSNVQKVLWALEELGRPYEVVERGGQFGGLEDAEFRRLTPFRQVPVLVDDELVAVESGAILRHLGRGAGGAAFWPSDPERLVWAEAMMDWTIATLWPSIRPPFIAVAREGVPRDSEALGRQVAAVAGPLGMLETLLRERDWLSGDEFGFADIPASVAISRLVWLVGRRALPEHVRDWYGRCEERPGWQAVVHVDG